MKLLDAWNEDIVLAEGTAIEMIRLSIAIFDNSGIHCKVVK